MSNPSPTDLPRTRAVIEDGIAQGLHWGAQLYVSVDSSTVAELAFGQVRPGIAMGRDVLMPWLSCSKPIMAVALAQLREKGLLEFDDPVIRFIPQFAAGGKESITLKHILTHTAGLRFPKFDWPAPREQMIEQLCTSPIEKGWPIGQKAGYSPFASWFVLGEVVRRLDGRTYEDYCREETFAPLEMGDSWMLLPPEQYRAYGQDRIGVMMDTKKSPPQPTGDDGEETAAAPRPSGGGRGPVRELARFYEMLQREGSPILSADSLALLTAPHRVGMFDHTFGAVMDWGLGFILNRNDPAMPYNYGARASMQSFGHSGAESSCAFCDPANQLVVAWATNGQPGNAKHQQRQRAINTAIYEDLALA